MPGKTKVPVSSFLRNPGYYIISCAFLLLPLLPLRAAAGDSLLRAVQGAKNDTARARVMLALARELQPTDPNSAMRWADSALTITREKGPEELHADAAMQLGILCNGKGLYQVALKYFVESLPIFEKQGNLLAQARVQNNIGNTYIGKQDYKRSAEAFNECVRLAVATNNLRMQAVGNIGIATCFSEEDRIPEAIAYVLKSRNLFHQLGEKENEAFTQSVVGSLYLKIEEYDKAEQQIDSAMIVFQQGTDMYRLFTAEKLLGDIYRETNRPEKALEVLLRSVERSRQMDAKDNTMRAYVSISETYESINDYKKALDYYKLYNEYEAAVFNIENSRQLLEVQEAFGAEKKQREIEVQKEQIRQQDIRQNLLLGGIVLLLIIAFLVYRQYKAKQRSNQKLGEAYAALEQKNEEIDLKNQEITASIRYAKRIQESFLPEENHFRSLAPDSFLLYKPKDIVSGDFYWMNRVGDVVVMAVADCTGHGVPGAFLSAICNDLMNHVIRDSGVVQPDAVLYALDEKLRQLQGKSGNSHDGMDIALCTWNSVSRTLLYAGARRPLLLFQNGELTELGASKFSIGEQVGEKKFEVRTLALNPGDAFYLFSDGYADQFGGPQGKKFKYRRFQELLLENAHQPMNTQCEILTQALLDWKGGLEQVDDVCIMGIRITAGM